MPEKNTLLQRYLDDQDPDAFAEIVREHAGMVYGTALRIVRGEADAEDVAQECYLELARKAGTIKESVGGWLHTLTTRRATNWVRGEARRKVHENNAMKNSDSNHNESAWGEIGPHVDEALEELPAEIRLPLIRHYLEGRPQRQVAQEVGVALSEVNRQLKKGVEILRGILENRGVICAAAALGTLLVQNAASAAPSTLMASLGKLAIAGVRPEAVAATGGLTEAASVGTAATKTAATGAAAGKAAVAGKSAAIGIGLGAAKVKAIAAAAVFASVVGGAVVYKASSERRAPTPKTVEIKAAVKPEPAKTPQAGPLPEKTQTPTLTLPQAPEEIAEQVRRHLRVVVSIQKPVRHREIFILHNSSFGSSWTDRIDPELTKANALEAIVKIGPAAVPHLIQALKDPEKKVRDFAVKALGKISPAAVAELMRALKNKESLVRINAAWALGQIGPGAKEAVPDLIEALDDQSSEVRNNAAFALGSIGPETNEAIPPLIQAL